MRMIGEVKGLGGNRVFAPPSEVYPIDPNVPPEVTAFDFDSLLRHTPPPSRCRISARLFFFAYTPDDEHFSALHRSPPLRMFMTQEILVRQEVTCEIEATPPREGRRSSWIALRNFWRSLGWRLNGHTGSRDGPTPPSLYARLTPAPLTLCCEVEIPPARSRLPNMAR